MTSPPPEIHPIVVSESLHVAIGKMHNSPKKVQDVTEKDKQYCFQIRHFHYTVTESAEDDDTGLPTEEIVIISGQKN